MDILTVLPTAPGIILDMRKSWQLKNDVDIDHSIDTELNNNPNFIVSVFSRNF